MVEGLVCVLCIGRSFALTSRLTNMVQSGSRWLRFQTTITYHVDPWRRSEPKERNVPKRAMYIVHMVNILRTNLKGELNQQAFKGRSSKRKLKVLETAMFSFLKVRDI